MIKTGDCLLLLQELKSESVDLIVTDPPYGIDFRRKVQGNKRLVRGDDGFTVMFFIDDLCRQLHRVLKDGCAIYLFTRFDVMPYWWISMSRFFQMKNAIVWHKRGGFTGDLRGNYGNVYEQILFGVKGRHVLNGKRTGNVWEYSKAKLEYHDTQKPTDLLQDIVCRSSQSGATILDPYCGSASTGVACSACGRKFLGFEHDSEVADIARQRLGCATQIKDAGSTSANMPQGKNAAQGELKL